MNHKLANDKKLWTGNGNTAALLFSLKALEIFHLERRGQVKTIVMEHFNGILFHKSEPANKQHTNQSFNQLLLTLLIRIKNQPVEIYIRFQKENSNLTVIQTPDLQISSMAHCQLRHPGSISSSD